MSITYRQPDETELDAVVAAGELPFGDEVQPADAEYFKELIELDRALVADDGGRIVGVGCGLTSDVSVPGGRAVPMGNVGLVSVLPTHRRRGVARALLRHVHAGAIERGEPLAGLMASESKIYGRFGYGTATQRADTEIATAHAQLREPVDLRGRVRFVEPDEATELVLDGLDALRATVPGIPGRIATRVRGRLRRDPAHWRDGAGARMLVAFEDRGVIAYRVKQDWHATGPSHTVLISDLVARDDEALAGLWTYCLDLDLVSTVKAFFRPVDEPLGHLLVDPRRLSAAVGDALWLRILDVPGALRGRRYDADGAWTIAVVDPDGFAAGTYRLEVTDGEASVEETDADADATVPADSLGAAYLGGIRLTGLARAGRAAEHRPGALRALDRAFASDPLPWSPFEI